MFRKNTTQEKAFTILELAIILVISGIFLSFGAATISTIAIANKFKKNTQILEDIEEALIEYFQDNKKLPCPADITLDVTDANYTNGAYATGEYCDSYSGTSLQFESSNVDICSTSLITFSNIIHKGAVPVSDLGFDREYMFDAWGNKLSYIVDGRFTCNGLTTSPGDVFNSELPEIIVKDTDGNNITSNAIFAVISHGEDDRGAYQKNGTKKSEAGADQLENSDNDRTIVYSDILDSGDSLVANFDDEMIFKTKFQLLSENTEKTFGSEECLCNDSGLMGKDVVQERENFCFGVDIIEAPTEIDDLECWIDFSDRSTIFEDDSGTDLAEGGDQIALATDKSGAGGDCDLNQNTDSKKPDYILNTPKENLHAAHFSNDTSGDRLNFNSLTAINGGSAFTYIIAYRKLDDDAGEAMALLYTDSMGGGSQNNRIFHIDDDSMGSTNELRVTGTDLTSNDAMNDVGDNLVVLAREASGAVSERTRPNQANISRNDTITAPTGSASNIKIGPIDSSQQWYLDAYVYELLVYDRELTVSEILAIENYLIKKWDLDL